MISTNTASALRHSLLVFLIFLPLPIIGTQLHELGHAAVAWSQGKDVTIHYGSMNYSGGIEDRMNVFWQQSKEEILRDSTSSAARTFETLVERVRMERLWVSLGGPVSTMVIGTVGLLLLVRQRRGDRRQELLAPAEWVAMIAALFWSRELFVLLLAIAGILLGSSGTSDEHRIALALGLPWWSVTVLLGIIGGGVCVVALWHYPRSLWVPFLVGGISACAVGYIFWYSFAGPILLP